MISTQRPLARAAPQLLAAFRARSSQTQPLRIANVYRQSRQLSFQPTRRLKKTFEDDQKAQTVTSRLAQIKKIPVELWPLAAVLAIAIVAAAYSLINKMRTDVTLRLWRKGKAAPAEEHH